MTRHGRGVAIAGFIVFVTCLHGRRMPSLFSQLAKYIATKYCVYMHASYKSLYMTVELKAEDERR